MSKNQKSPLKDILEKIEKEKNNNLLSLEKEPLEDLTDYTTDTEYSSNEEPEKSKILSLTKEPELEEEITVPQIEKSKILSLTKEPELEEITVPQIEKSFYQKHWFVFSIILTLLIVIIEVLLLKLIFRNTEFTVTISKTIYENLSTKEKEKYTPTSDGKYTKKTIGLSWLFLILVGLISVIPLMIIISLILYMLS